MNHRLRQIATLLAVAAMLLRAAIPPGWMPSASAGHFLSLCTASGLVQVVAALPIDVLETAHGTHTQTAGSGPDCPFGAIAAPPLPTAANESNRFETPRGGPTVPAVPAWRRASPTGSHRARAPPLPRVA